MENRIRKKIAGDEKIDVSKAHEFLDELEQKYFQKIRNYDFPTVELVESRPLDEVCQIFESLNKKGIKLGVFELLTARLYPHDINLRDLWKATREESNIIKEFYGTENYDSDDTMLKIVTLLIQRNGSNPLSPKRKDVLNLTHNNFKKHWDRAAKLLHKTLEILKAEYGVLSRTWLPYVTIVVPFSIILGIVENEVPGPKKIECNKKVARWYWCSVFSQRYDQAADTRAVKDITEMTAWFKDDKTVPEAVRNFREGGINLRSVTGGVVYSGVISLLIKNGAKDFHDGTKISTQLVIDKNVDGHHIFPKKYLESIKIKGDDVDCILNKTLISASTNRRIKDKSPKVYLEEIEKEVGRAGLYEILKSHYTIDSGDAPIFEDKFKEFIEEREKLILKAISIVVESKE